MSAIYHLILGMLVLVKFIALSMNLLIKAFMVMEYISDLTLDLNLFGKFEGYSCVNLILLWLMYPISINDAHSNPCEPIPVVRQITTVQAVCYATTL